MSLTQIIQRDNPMDMDLCLVTGNDAIAMTFNAIQSAVSNTDLDLRIHIYALNPSIEMKKFLSNVGGNFTKIVYADSHFETVEQCRNHFKEALKCMTDTADIVGFLPVNIILRPNWAKDAIYFLNKYEKVGIVGIYNDIIHQNLHYYWIFDSNRSKMDCFVDRKFHVNGIQLMRKDTYLGSKPLSFNQKYGIAGFESLETSLNVFNSKEEIINVYLPNQWAFYYQYNEIYSFHQRISAREIEIFDKHVKDIFLSKQPDLYDNDTTSTGQIY